MFSGRGLVARAAVGYNAHDVMKRLYLIVFCSLVLAAGCDREHEAAPTVRAFLDAVKYGDVDGMFDRHVDSTRQSPWCAKEFEKALSKAQRESSADCARLREMTAADLDALSDEMRTPPRRFLPSDPPGADGPF